MIASIKELCFKSLIKFRKSCGIGGEKLKVGDNANGTVNLLQKYVQKMYFGKLTYN